MNKKVYLVNDTSDDLNWGCNATSLALKEILRDKGHIVVGEPLLKKASGAETGGFKKYIKKIAHYISSRSKFLNGLVFSLIKAYKKNKHDYIPYSVEELFANEGIPSELKEEEHFISDSDVVLINGEGSIYDSQRKGFFLLTLAHYSKSIMGKPTFMVNHTCSLTDRSMRNFVDKIYPKLDGVLFREEVSQNEYKALNQADTFEVVPDAAYYYFRKVKIKSQYLDSKKIKKICLGGSSFFGRIDRYYKDPVASYIDLIKKLRGKGYSIVFACADEVDEAIYLRIKEAIRDLDSIPLQTPTNDILDSLSGCDLHISGRWHPAILAACVNVPTISLSANTFKTKAFQKQVGLNIPIIDASNFSAELIISEIESLNIDLEVFQESVSKLSKLSVRNISVLDEILQ
ncbi:polysaccharide pyruvyl transferase family protein [Marinomonas balearica]|uniref:Polysaccharide pyruvyl transferase n=1 Tax=Marinomonas balearica TaxID=491947 RepID=A0A4R6M3W0_9GAMM|nr:polysaccharide pyruvyl transferase family protein [Marinomonas balearica]TDO95988.1 polysaccharide pyruvyl transferase [Marinomonas balearica]